MYVQMYVCVCVHIHTYIHVHTYITRSVMRTLFCHESESESVSNMTNVRVVQGGTPLFEQNSEGDNFGIVMTGHLRVFYNRK